MDRLCATTSYKNWVKHLGSNVIGGMYLGLSYNTETVRKKQGKHQLIPTIKVKFLLSQLRKGSVLPRQTRTGLSNMV